jgi:1-deoxy-D-xylulose 5-phosphate reductoisomerase
MKKKIVILGSTGSIGKTTIEIIKKDKNNFDIILLSANNNFKEINKQIKYLKPKNLVINNKKIYLKLKKKYKKINIFHNFDLFFKNFIRK